MALIKCPDCGKEVSDSSKFCLNCGYPIEGRLFSKGLSIDSSDNLIWSQNCNDTHVKIPPYVTSIGNSAFSGSTTLRTITIPNSVTSIGDYAFRDCTNLTSITIPSSVTSIGNSAFYNFSSLSSLTSITIPNSVTSIGDEVFYNCKCDITYQGTIAQWKTIDKSIKWNYGYTHKIICSDGTI